MPDQTVPTTRGVSLAVTLHTETVSTVRTVDLSEDGDRVVSLKLGDDIRGVDLLGPLDDVRRVIVEADRQLTHLADEGKKDR
jgi:hypothetical protein